MVKKPSLFNFQKYPEEEELVIMNIIVVGKFYPESFGLHIAETLKAMGHFVLRFEPGWRILRDATGPFQRLRQVIGVVQEVVMRVPVIKKLDTNDLFRKCKDNRVDLILVTHDYLLPGEIAIVKRLTDAPIVLWHPDSIASCGKFMFLNGSYDFLFFKDPYMVKVFQKELKKSAYYLPECCNPVHHRVIDLTEEDRHRYGCDITTAGNLNPNREAFFRHLSGFHVKIWGSLPPTWLDTSAISQMIMGQYVLNEEKAKAFRAAKIVVNNLSPSEIWGLNCRAFEIPACGGFQLVNWRPGISQLFEDGKELVSFQDVEDLKGKVAHYLVREEERHAIADAGFKRVQQEHTYVKRISLLLDTVAGVAKGFPLPDIRMQMMPLPSVTYR